MDKRSRSFLRTYRQAPNSTAALPKSCSAMASTQRAIATCSGQGLDANVCLVAQTSGYSGPALFRITGLDATDPIGFQLIQFKQCTQTPDTRNPATNQGGGDNHSFGGCASTIIQAKFLKPNSEGRLAHFQATRIAHRPKASLQESLMNATFVRCQCLDPNCQCQIEVAKAVMRNGKAFCSEGCADGHGCGCNRGDCPNAPIL